MRRLAFLAAVLLGLAGCAVKEEGRTCTVQSHCPTGQGCGFDGKCSKAAESCDAASCAGAAPRCEPGTGTLIVAQTCEPRPGTLCGQWVDKVTCDSSYQTCEEATSTCVCRGSGGCSGGTGAYLKCSADGQTVLSCRLDDTCHHLVGSTPCGADQVCGDTGTPSCVARILSVTVDSPTPSTRVEPAGSSVQVQATVTLGSAALADYPPTLGVKEDGALLAATLGSPVKSGASVQYTGTYAPAAGIEKDVVLTVVAGTVESAGVTVKVDTQPPSVTNLLASCGVSVQPDCQRDDAIDIQFDVVDRSGVSSVQVSLDLDGYTRQVPASLNLGHYEATLRLGEAPGWPFNFLSHPVQVRVLATDTAGAGNGGSTDLGALLTTRLRSSTGVASAAVTAPASLADGTLVVGVAATASQLRGFPPAPATPWSFTLQISPTESPRPIVWAPAIGEKNLWVTSEDGRIYRRALDGSPVATGTARWPPGDTTTIPANSLRGVAVRVDQPGTASSVDRAYAAGAASTLWQFWSNEVTGSLALGQPATAAPVWSGARLFGATGPTGGPAKLRRFADVALSPSVEAETELEDAGAVKCDEIQELAVDGAGNVIAACKNGQLHRVPPDFTTGVASGTLLASSGLAPTAPVLVSNSTNDVVVALDDGSVRAYRPGVAAAVWSADASGGAGMNDKVTGLVAVTANPWGARLYAVTRQGRVLAIGDDGSVVWSATLNGGSALSAPVVVPASSGPPARLPAICTGSSSGMLHCVVADGELDVAAPWPKARHDNRNTGNAASPVP